MSTFRGVMAEFPDVRVDFFRRDPELRAPLACFLSHVHSDHLAGLETLKAPFVYCSPATKEILMRLERYPHRLNFQLGILESRKQTYKNLDKLLKPIPLETPTKIELEPGSIIKVTLFDANHCPGSVMFLFESHRNAVLYTGDIRSEPWFVNSLTRNPFLIEYTSELKRLDCIYLDTSNTEDISFPTQAEGLKELLQKVSEYPLDTVFHFTAWTYGYEKVWMALSKTLNSQIHVDRYKLRIYESLCGKTTDKNRLSGPFIASEGPVLVGYQCGNTPNDGCLTENPDVRIHSCEKGMHCSNVNSNTIWIKPIITRHNGVEIGEVGVGGGGGDLTQRPELELDTADALEQLLGLFEDEDDREDVKYKLLAVLKSTKMAISLEDLGLLGLDRDQDEMSLAHFANLVSRSKAKKQRAALVDGPADNSQALPKVITFPYSRHSSFPELCALVSAFKPKDVYPCTVDEEEWHEGVSIRAQFGCYCSNTEFRHDFEMRAVHTSRVERAASEQTLTTECSQASEDRLSFVGESPKAKTSTIRRFDAEGYQVEVVSEVATNLEVDTESSRKVTPPQEIIARSPGSESQSLRRKHILGDLIANHAKRARFQFDGAASPLPADSEEQSQLGLAHPRISSFSKTLEQISLVAGWGSENDRVSTAGDDNNNDMAQGDDRLNEYLDYMDSSTYFDIEDLVRRCGLCGHELWSQVLGSCTNCEEGQFGDPYLETTEEGPSPKFTVDEYVDTFMDAKDRRKMVGDYLDDQSSAYDSQDEEEKFTEEYEINSFIDDSSQVLEVEKNEDDLSDCETDWKQKFLNQQAKNVVAQNHVENLQEAYHDALEELGVVFGDEAEDEMEEDGVLVVNTSAPDPVVTELILSQAQEQSQGSEVSEERIRDRVEAFEAAESARGWHSISLISTRDNHTEEEVEL